MAEKTRERAYRQHYAQHTCQRLAEAYTHTVARVLFSGFSFRLALNEKTAGLHCLRPVQTKSSGWAVIVVVVGLTIVRAARDERNRNPVGKALAFSSQIQANVHSNAPPSCCCCLVGGFWVTPTILKEASTEQSDDSRMCCGVS